MILDSGSFDQMMPSPAARPPRLTDEPPNKLLVPILGLSNPST